MSVAGQPTLPGLIRQDRNWREWPLAMKVMLTLTIALLPLGIVAMLVAIENYQEAPLRGMSPLQLFGIAAPILMWLGALLIGWRVASALIVEPLIRMRLAVDRYAAGDSGVRLSGRRFLSHEIGCLAAAFDAMADAVARHDGETAAALAEQARLTREVHHRVKNNLQIVSSLLSLQARDATTSEVARAYARVQARVAALAVVHRWMFEGGSTDGAGDVDVRALATDLAAGLEQHLTLTEALPVRLHCDIGAILVGQDTAVPLAFLITEIASLAACLTTPEPLAMTVAVTSGEDRATLTIAAPCFVGDDHLSPGNDSPVSRIVNGMTRQLRSPLRHDAATGCYAIGFPLVAGATAIP